MIGRRNTAHSRTGAGRIDRRSLLLALPFAAVTTPSFGETRPASAKRLGVLYASSERFKPILDATFAGLEAAAGDWVIERRLLRPGVDADETRSWLKAPVDAWMLLGAEARSLAEAHGLDPPAVTGLQYVSPNENRGFGGVSLDFDPETVLPKVQALLPSHNRIQAVYIQGRDDWIVDRLRKSAAMRGFAVAPVGAGGLREATDHLGGILRYGNPATDIIWIPGGPDLVTRDTAAHLFQQAYNARFPVFANRRAWVNEGAFLGGEPDFQSHGAQLARVLNRMIASGKPQYEMTARISFALNVRVARRIGVTVSEEVRRSMGALVADD